MSQSKYGNTYASERELAPLRPLAARFCNIDAAMTEYHRELNATNRDAIDRFVAALAHSEEDEADGAGDDGFLFLRLPSRACAVCSVP